MSHLYKQSITIDSIDYIVIIDLNTASVLDNVYYLVVIGEGREYKTEFSNIDKSLDRLQNGLRLKSGIVYSGAIINDTLVLTLSHPFIKMDDKYVCKLVNKDVSLTTIIDTRLKQLEDDSWKIYVITEEMLGPCMSVNKSMILTPTKLDEILHKVTTSSTEKELNEIWYELHKYVDDLSKLYHIKYVYSAEKPVITENQVIVNNILRHDKSGSKKIVVENSYTIYSKKHNTNILGFIKKHKNLIEISFLNRELVNFSFASRCPNVSTYQKDNHVYYKCSKTEYFKSCYFIKLPFDVENDIICPTDYSSYLVFVRNNQIYTYLEYVKEDVFMSPFNNNPSAVSNFSFLYNTLSEN
jgi:hypothetical protein